jgi:PAS domain-containing protein
MYQYSNVAERWGPPATAPRPTLIRYAILMLDDACRIAGCDEGAASMFGYDRHDLIGTHVSEIFPGVAWSPQSSSEAWPGRCCILKLSRVGLDGRRADGSRFPIVASLLQDADRTLLVRIRSLEA